MEKKDGAIKDLNIMDCYVCENGFKDFYNENRQIYSDFFNQIINKNEEAFEAGYKVGVKEGIQKGERKVKEDIIVKLLTGTEITDEQIYEIIGEDNNYCIERIKNIRDGVKKQKIMWTEKSISIVKEYMKEIENDESKKDEVVKLNEALEKFEEELVSLSKE